MLTRRIVWAVDKHMHPKEFMDKLYEYDTQLHSVKINSYYHFLCSKYPLFMCNIEDHIEDVDFMLDLKIYDTPKTVAATIKALPKVAKYVTLTWAEDNNTSVEAGLGAAAERGMVCFLVNRLTSALPGTEEQTRKFLNFLVDVSTKFENVGVVLPADRLRDLGESLPWNVATLTPGVVIKEFCKQDYSDQKVVTTPEDVVKMGGDLIVLGRSMPPTAQDLVDLNDRLEKIR